MYIDEYYTLRKILYVWLKQLICNLKKSFIYGNTGKTIKKIT